LAPLVMQNIRHKFDMNLKEAYMITNSTLQQFAGQCPIQEPDKGTDREKVQYLLDEYSTRLKRKFWRYLLIRNNRKIPEMVCQYLGKMLTEDEEKAQPRVSVGRKRPRQLNSNVRS
jgi:hypothetical protein